MAIKEDQSTIDDQQRVEELKRQVEDEMKQEEEKGLIGLKPRRSKRNTILYSTLAFS